MTVAQFQLRYILGGQNPRKLPKNVLLPAIDRLFEREGTQSSKVIPMQGVRNPYEDDDRDSKSSANESTLKNPYDI